MTQLQDHLDAVRVRFAAQHITATPLPAFVTRVSRTPNGLAFVEQDLARDLGAVECRIYPGYSNRLLIVYRQPEALPWML